MHHIRQSTCLSLHSGSPECEAQTLFVQPVSSIIILIVFYTSWAKMPVTAIYMCYHLTETLKSALNFHCLSASFKSLLLIETHKTYQLLLIPLSSRLTFLFIRSPNLGPMKHPYLMVLQYSQDGTMLNITKLKLLSQFTEWKYSVWSSRTILEGLFYCMFCISVVFD